MTFYNILCGIIAGTIALITYAVISTNITFGYKRKAINLLYNLYGQLALLENGIEYYNETIVYTSIQSIWNTLDNILKLNNTVVFCNRKLVKVVNTFAAQCISLLICIGQINRGYGIESERIDRIDQIKRAFYFNGDTYVMSYFAFELASLLKDGDVEKSRIWDMHILDNKMQIGIYKSMNKTDLFGSNEEIENALRHVYRRKLRKIKNKRDEIIINWQYNINEDNAINEEDKKRREFLDKIREAGLNEVLKVYIMPYNYGFGPYFLGCFNEGDSWIVYETDEVGKRKELFRADSEDEMTQYLLDYLINKYKTDKESK